MGATAEPSVAGGSPPSGGKASLRHDHRRDTTVVGLALRFALNARPTGSQGFAPGKANDKDKSKSRNKHQTQKGTFLTR